MQKKLIAGAAVGACMLPMLAFAQTTDVQSQIQSLLSQIQSLQQQLKTLIASSSASFHADLGVVASSSTPWFGGEQTPPGQIGKLVCVTLNRNLGIGAQGDDVKQIQQMLADDEGSDYRGGVTGFFGPLTAKAMADFQERMGIASSSSGIIGPLTRGFFERRCGKGLGDNSGDQERAAVFGTITANNTSSITIQKQNGDSIVANITASTTIMVINASSTPPAAGSVSDLVVGKTVNADGPRNQDGSIQAVHITVGVLPPQPGNGEHGNQGNDHPGQGQHGPLIPSFLMPLINSVQGNGGEQGDSHGPQNW